MKALRRACRCSVALVLVACTTHQPISQREGTPHQPTSQFGGPVLPQTPAAAKADSVVREAAAKGFTGEVFIAQNGSIVLYQVYGPDLPGGAGSDSLGALYEIASLTKQFTAAAVLRLQEQARLRVTDSLGVLLSNVPADKRRITIHQLLTHSSGLPRDVLDPDSSEVVSRDVLVQRVLALKLTAPPDSQFSYSNAGYQLLGALVEIVSGQPLGKFMQQELFRPAGLTHTSFEPSEGALGRRAVPASDSGYWRTRQRVPDGFWYRHGSGGLLSTAPDLYRWALALERGRVLSSSSTEQMFARHVRHGPRSTTATGYGWQISPSGRETEEIWVVGFWRGFYTQIERFPAERTVIILMTTAKGDGIIDPILAALFPRAAGR